MWRDQDYETWNKVAGVNIKTLACRTDSMGRKPILYIHKHVHHNIQYIHCTSFIIILHQLIIMSHQVRPFNYIHDKYGLFHGNIHDPKGTQINITNMIHENFWSTIFGRFNDFQCKLSWWLGQIKSQRFLTQTNLKW